MTTATVGRMLAAGVLFVGFPSEALAQDLPEMPSFEDVLSLKGVAGAAISPDGTAVAYVVRRADFEENRFDSEIWIASHIWGEDIELPLDTGEVSESEDDPPAQ